MSETCQNKTLKIAFYCFFPGGGIGQYTHELLKRLSEMEAVHVSLFCTPDFEWISRATYEVRPILYDISSQHPLLRKMRFVSGQWISPSRMLKEVRKRRFDIVHFCNINHLSYPFWKRSLGRLKILKACTAHDIRRGKSILNRTWETRQLKQFYRDTCPIFVHSESQIGDLISFADISREGVVKVPLGPFSLGTATQIIAPTKSYSSPSKGLFFGNLRDEKNLDGLLRAMAKSKEDMRLTVAGKPGGSGHHSIAYYKRLAQKLALGNKVDWIIRHIPDKEAHSLFQATDWVALPYKNVFTSQSGVLNIATHYGKPILATPAPTFNEVFDQYPIGVLSRDMSDASITKALSKMVCKCRVKGAFDFSSYQRDHTWERNAELTLQAYRSQAMMELGFKS
jgi:glycosyltransferase involved in cell wall biosynthesis